MAQGVLPFKYEAEKNRGGMTALAGLPTYLCRPEIELRKYLNTFRAPTPWSNAEGMASDLLTTSAPSHLAHALRTCDRVVVVNARVPRPWQEYDDALLARGLSGPP
jgi:hypothetical protein